MDTDTHTPGPWQIGKDRLSTLDVTTSDGTPIANVDMRVDGSPHYPNARLIAAAPELLAALRATEALLTGQWVGYEADARRAALAQVRAALEKVQL